MGEIRRKPNWLEHNEADPGSPEKWVVYTVDDCGKILPACLHTDDVSVAVEPDTGRLIFALGTNLISCSSAVAAAVVAALGTQTAGAVKVAEAAEIASVVERTARVREQAAEELAEELGRKGKEATDQIAALDGIIEQKRNEAALAQAAHDEAIARLETEIATKRNELAAVQTEIDRRGRPV